jgi:AraC-like DNA-binding protein
MPQGDQRVAEVMDITLKYTLESLAGEIRMSHLAQLVGMSESGFSKYFVKASNMTFTEMVRGLRLSQACRMLARDDVTIASVSQQVGYTNLSNVNRQSMGEYGMTQVLIGAARETAPSRRAKALMPLGGRRPVNHSDAVAVFIPSTWWGTGGNNCCTRPLDPGASLARLGSRLDALGPGPVDLPRSQRTLRATVE